MEGVDVRRPAGKQVGLQGALDQFRAEVPVGQISVNLGCGGSPLEGFVNVDWIASEGVDVAADLFKPNWPIADESVGFVFMSHMLEHVPGEAWGTFWTEMWRICADGARVVVMSPYGTSTRFQQDPTHCQPLVDEKFLYLSKSWREMNKLNHGYYGCPELNFLQDIKPWRSWNQRMTGRSEETKEFARMTEWNAVDDCIWFCKAFKSDASLEAYKAQVERMVTGKEAQGAPTYRAD